MTFWNKGILMVLVTVVTTVNLLAQLKTKNGDLYLGPEIKSDRKGTLEDIVGMDSDGYYMVRAEPKKFYLEKYDHKLHQVKSEEIELGKGVDRKYLEFAEQLNDEIYLFTTQYDNTAKQRTLFAEKVNRKTLKREGDPMKLTTYDYRNRSNEGYFDYHVSRDSSKILIYYDTPNQSGNAGEKFGLSVYDSDLNTLWSKELVLPFRDKLYTVERYKVDNRGNAYLLGMVYRGQVRAKRQGRPNYEYHLLVYNQDDEYTEYLLNLKDKFITDMQFEISSAGDIICSGLYSDFSTTSVKGTFYLLINSKTREVKKEYYEQFDPSFLADFMSEKRAGKGRELTRYNLNQLEIRRDGGVVLVAEQFFAKEEQYNDYRYRSPYGNPYYYPGYFYSPSFWRYPYRYGYPFMNEDREVQYNYNDIIVINIDPNGSIQWAKRIPKRQRSKNDGGRHSSYAMSISNGKMFFIFNDNPKNLHKTSGDQRIHNFTKGKESVVVLVSLDGKGEVEKEPLFQVKDTKTITKPLVCEQISRDQMIIYSEKNKKATFARLTFQ